jgi:hypothetical protein
MASTAVKSPKLLTRPARPHEDVPGGLRAQLPSTRQRRAAHVSAPGRPASRPHQRSWGTSWVGGQRQPHLARVVARVEGLLGRAVAERPDDVVAHERAPWARPNSSSTSFQNSLARTSRACHGLPHRASRAVVSAAHGLGPGPAPLAQPAPPTRRRARRCQQHAVGVRQLRSGTGPIATGTPRSSARSSSTCRVTPAGSARPAAVSAAPRHHREHVRARPLEHSPSGSTSRTARASGRPPCAASSRVVAGAVGDLVPGQPPDADAATRTRARARRRAGRGRGTGAERVATPWRRRRGATGATRAPTRAGGPLQLGRAPGVERRAGRLPPRPGRRSTWSAASSTTPSRTSTVSNSAGGARRPARAVPRRPATTRGAQGLEQRARP